MRHLRARRKLGRETSHRYAMLRNLVTSVLEHERVVTTLAKAKEARPMTEKLITLAKKDSLHARRRALSVVRDRAVVAKLFDTISARFAQRPGGYTRIISTGIRRGDGSPMAILELLDSDWYRQKAEREKAKKEKAKGKPGEKKEEKAKEKPAKEKAEEKPAKTKAGKAGGEKKAAPKAAKAPRARRSAKGGE